MALVICIMSCLVSYSCMKFVSFQEDKYPNIMVAVFVVKPLPFLEEMLDKVSKLNYPKKRIDLFVHNQVSHCDM